MKLKELTRGKGLARLESLALLAIIIIMLLTSFGTIFTLSLNVSDDFEEKLDSVLYELTGEEDIKLSKEINVDFMFLVKTVTTIVDVVTVLDDLEDDKSSDNPPVENLSEEELKSLTDLVVFAFAIVSRFGDITEIDDIKQMNAKTVIDAIIFFVCIIYFIFFTITIVLTLFFATLKAIFGFLFSGRNAGKAAARISSSIYRVIKRFPGLVVILLLTDEIKYGSAVNSLLILCIASLGIGLLVSRLKKYDSGDFKYLNILQAVSAVSVVGLVMFVLNVIKTNILMEGLYQTFTVEFIENLSDGDVDFPLLMFIVLLFVSVYIALRSIPRVVTRFACMSNSRSPANIAKTFLTLFAIAIPVIMMNYEGIGFKLSDDQYTSFILASVGIGIMFIAEIVLSVLIDHLCDDCSEENQQKILSGAYVYLFENPIDDFEPVDQSTPE